MNDRKRRRDNIIACDDDDQYFLNMMYRHYIMFFYFFYSLSSVYGFDSKGNKTSEIPRERKDLEVDIFRPLGKYMFRRAYRMNKQSFYKLHDILKPRLDTIFFPKNGGKRDPMRSAYLISTKVRLSIAIRYFSGGSPYDIMLTHGVSFKFIFVSIWGVVDAVNSTKELEFSFPDHQQQRNIASGFYKMSGANFSNVIGAIDGILIWMMKPSLKWCRKSKCGEAQYKCFRKDKFGMNMQAICDHKLRFLWIDIQWPGSTSDYLAWVTSSLCHDLDNNDTTNILLNGMTIVGNNAYVKKHYMSVPLKGQQINYNDAYNFYLSQLRITIERAFGALVHRWSILRGPLLMPLTKVAPTVMCLCRLHNYCINANESNIEKMTVRSSQNITRNVSFSNHMSGSSSDQVAVSIDENSCPTDLLGHGHHFHDAPTNRRTETTFCPMDGMIEQVKDQNLQRPRVKGRDNK